MGSGWFNLVLTLCAVRGFGRTMGDMKKPSSRGSAWLRGEAVVDLLKNIYQLSSVVIVGVVFIRPRI